MKQPRWKSPVAWTALAALVFFVIKYWVGYEIPMFDEFISLALAAALAFGILNNPTQADGF